MQVGAAIMHAVGRVMRLSEPATGRGLILAVGTAGISAAFNTPLGGIVSAIEALSHSFEARTSGTMPTAVILSGVTSLALVGIGTYLGTPARCCRSAWAGWRCWPVASSVDLAAVAFSAAFSAILVRLSALPPGSAVGFVPRPADPVRRPLRAAAGRDRHPHLGTGYPQARPLIDGTATGDAAPGPAFFFWEFLASMVSAAGGIPGGVFAPSRSIGAGIGGSLAALSPYSHPAPWCGAPWSRVSPRWFRRRSPPP